MRDKFTKISAIQVYVPTQPAEVEEKDGFNKVLEEVMNNIPGYNMKMIIGDTSAKIGTAWGRELQGVRVCILKATTMGRDFLAVQAHST